MNNNVAIFLYALLAKSISSCLLKLIKQLKTLFYFLVLAKLLCKSKIIRNETNLFNKFIT